jgi:hypothetical protein
MAGRRRRLFILWNGSSLETRPEGTLEIEYATVTPGDLSEDDVVVEEENLTTEQTAALNAAFGQFA